MGTADQRADESGHSAAAAGESIDSKVLLDVLARVKAGDFTARMPLDWTNVAGKVADDLNAVIIANQTFETEVRPVKATSST